MFQNNCKIFNMDITNTKVIKKNPKVNQTSNKKFNVGSDGHELEQDLKVRQIKASVFLKALKRDYKRLALIYNSYVKAEQERERRNKEEIDHLKKIYNQMQVERANVKRKRWCRYCESEANYLSSIGTNFYCSRECQQKQNEFVSAMEAKSEI